MLHQFEEYQYPGGFKEFFNQTIYNKTWIIRFPLNDTAIFMVNVVVAWTAYTYSALHPEYLWLALGLFCITFFNGFLHSFLFFRKKKYNPGFYTGLFLFIPFSSYAIYTLSEVLTWNDWISGLTIFVIGTAAIPGSIYLSNKIA
jgi:tryptophan-rich sensory protein